MRALIIEDEKRLADTLADMIGDSGYRTDITYDGLGGLGLIKSSIYDAIVLDAMLPGLSGLDVLSCLRDSRIMTSVLTLIVKSALADHVRGLDAGVDYYLTKLFKNQKFPAYLRAMLRRQADITSDPFIYGDLLLTSSTSQPSCNGWAVSLSARGLELMRLLIQNCSQFLPKEVLPVKVWGYDSSVNANSVEACISFLREKLSLLDPSTRVAVVRNTSHRLEVS